MVRLFVALELSHLQKQALTLVRGGVESARWQSDDQLHLTLAFIGETPEYLIDEIEGALSSIRFEPFELALAGVGSFGKPGKPKCLWAGVADRAPVDHLHEKVLRTLEGVDIDTDRRRFKPHVTLARFPKKQIKARTTEWLTTMAGIRTPAATISHFTLFASHLTQGGAHYQPLARYGQLGRLDAEFCEPDLDGLQVTASEQSHMNQQWPQVI